MSASAISTVDSLSVIDPCNRTGKISIPASFVSVTKGVSDYLKHGGNPPPDVKDLSLCLLYQKGRCNAGDRCNQVHAEPDFVAQVRARALAVRSCCAAHGDVHSHGIDANRTVAVSKDGVVNVYSLADFAMTPSLDTALTRARAGTIRVQSTRLCRLHLNGSCKFGRDCKNIHICPAARPQTVTEARPAEPTAVQTPAPVPPALGLAFRAVNINQRCADDAATVGSASCYAPCDTSANTSASDFGEHGVGPRALSSAPVDVMPLSVLSIMDEFNSMTGCHPHDAHDPLDIIDDDSASSAVDAMDFGAFVDCLVRCGQGEPMASPQWIVA
jgi:hypothetical protein